VQDACQAEYDQVPSEFYANDPIALADMVDNHGVIVHKDWPDSILEAGANASRELLIEILDEGDALTKKTVESYIKNLNLLRTRTESVDLTFARAREKYFDISDLG